MTCYRNQHTKLWKTPQTGEPQKPIIDSIHPEGPRTKEANGEMLSAKKKTWDPQVITGASPRI
jgi:hypothetical protein